MIKIRFSTGTGFAATMVKLGTWSHWSHVGFLLEDGRVLDATPERGVSVRVAEDDATTQYFPIDLPLPIVEAAVAEAMGEVGKPYDWSGCYGWAVRRDWHTTEAWFCSELVAWAFEQVRRPLLRTVHLNRVSPRDLYMSPFLIGEATVAAAAP